MLLPGQVEYTKVATCIQEYLAAQLFVVPVDASGAITTGCIKRTIPATQTCPAVTLCKGPAVCPPRLCPVVVSETDIVPIIIAVVAGALCLVLCVFGGDYYLKQAKEAEAKRLQAELKLRRIAAQGGGGDGEDVVMPSGEITLVDTDVESSTALWDWDATAMSEALISHDDILRAELTKNGGLELLTEGDAFLVCFSDMVRGVKWCLDVQSALMEHPWSDKLKYSGNESSQEVTVGGTCIFRGLRVRMGADCGAHGVSNANQIQNTEVYQRCHEISDFGHGGQVLVSNSLYAKLSTADLVEVDVAPVGNISDITGDEDSAKAISCVQLLPGAVKGRLSEFLPMYDGNEDAMRPPVGCVTCIFTACPLYKKTKESDAAGAEADVAALGDALEQAAEDTGGYLCKGSVGKYMLTFNTADAAVEFALQVNTALLNMTWKTTGVNPSRDDASGKMVFNGMPLAMGMATGEPQMFAYNRSSQRMDYFGPLVNLSARVMASSTVGEICLGPATEAALSPEKKSSLVIRSRGTFSLKGVQGETEIFHCTNPELEGRFAIYEELRQAYFEAMSPGAMSPGAMSPGAMSPQGNE